MVQVSLHQAPKRDSCGGRSVAEVKNFMLITHIVLKENQPWNILTYKENLCS
jgi:hypothetical protein